MFLFSESKKEEVQQEKEEESFLQYKLDISKHFELPISFIEQKKELKEQIVDDLELISTIDDTCEPIYKTTFNPQTEAGTIVLKEFPKLYTSDKLYLENTKSILQKYNIETEKDNEIVNDVVRIWKEVRGDISFLTKYNYIEMPYFQKWNYSEPALQFISMYTLASPVIALLVPFIICIVPLCVMKMRGIHLTWNEYMSLLKMVAANHSLFKLITSFNEVSSEQKAYLIFSSCIYLFSLYQNVLSCIRFYNNMKKIHGDLKIIRKYLDQTLFEMDNFLECSSELERYSGFNKSIKENKEKILKYKESVEKIYCEEISYKNIGQIGKLMKHFYILYDSDEYNSMFLYSLGFHGFIENMRGLILNTRSKKLGYSTFKPKKKSVFKKSYYGSLLDKDKTTNDIKLDKNMIITGPNASGKTTTLKTSLINVIITQQFGCGYYQSANLIPFEHIHCYLNIPDTSGRDSLFQAEARRCKQIIDIIQNNKKDRHFCVFDELYSGTNPDEAISSATAFMKYLLSKKTVKCILTTHYVSICRQLDDEKNLINNKMDTIPVGDGFKYTYTLKKGISEVKGGLKVLSDMDYPEEIINNTR
tara:strand:- start:5855 stop:7621 length:1767 start_codon:yes stop_codon:yes gene_type:complete